jgi:TonB family protein
MTLSNLLVWSAHAAVLIAAAEAVAALLKLHDARVLVVSRQLLLALALILPFAEPKAPPTAVHRIVASVSTTAVALHTPRPRIFPDPATALWLGLALGAAIGLLRIGYGMFTLRKLRLAADPVPDAHRALRARLEVKAEIYVSDAAAGPVTFGFFRPAVLVPRDCIDDGQIILHELLHVKRRDWAFALSERLVGALFWFHPAILWLLGRIQLSREQAVDHVVVALTGGREQYLRTLVSVAAGADIAPAPMFLKKRHLRERVAHLLEDRPMSRLRVLSSATAVGAAALFTIFLAARAMPLQAAQSSSSDSSVRSVTIHKIDVSAVPEALRDRVMKELGFAESQTVTMSQVEAAAKRVSRLDSRLFSFVSENEHGSVDVIVSAPNATATRIKVGGNVQQSQLVYRQMPKYPIDAKVQGLQGAVHLRIVIGRDGTVLSAERIDGDTTLAAAAIDAVRHWIYKPTLLNGSPVEVESVVTVNFTLQA